MAVTYSISGGADAALFTIDSATGKLAFKTAPDYENPTDANKDNVYEVTVKATDTAGASSTQDMKVTVKDVSENLPPQITSAAAVSINENTTDVTTVTATDPDAIVTPPPGGGGTPSGWEDGLAGAPAGAPQFPAALNNYPAGHGKRDKTIVNQPPFNVPGIDYRVGLSNASALVVPSSSNMPAGATFSGGNITVGGTGVDVTIQNFNMGNGTITVTAKSGKVSIKNCKWSLISANTPITYGLGCNITGYVGYCEMSCGGLPIPDGFIGWRCTQNVPCGNYTVEYCYFEKAQADGFDWRTGNGGLVLQYCVIYETGQYGNSSLHPDFVQIQSGGPQKFWNNLGYCPTQSTQGFGSWNPIYPATTSQNVSITQGGNAYSINTGDASFTTTNKFIFQNNYGDNKNIGSMLYPGYGATKSVVSGNILLNTGATFS